MTDTTKSQMQLEIENAHIDRTFYRIHDILDKGVGEVIDQFEIDKLQFYHAYQSCVKRRGLDWFVVMQYPVLCGFYGMILTSYSQAPELGKLLIEAIGAGLALLFLKQSVFKLSMFAYNEQVDIRYQKFLKKNPTASNKTKLKTWFDLHHDFQHYNAIDKECQVIFREWIKYYVEVYRGAYGNGR